MLLGRAGADGESTAAIVIVGGAAYAIAVVLLVRFGLANIGKLEDLGLTDSLASMPNRRALHLDYAAPRPEWKRPWRCSTSTDSSRSTTSTAISSAIA
jgi:hypothetical protein